MTDLKDQTTEYIVADGRRRADRLENEFGSTSLPDLIRELCNRIDTPYRNEWTASVVHDLKAAMAFLVEPDGPDATQMAVECIDAALKDLPNIEKAEQRLLWAEAAERLRTLASELQDKWPEDACTLRDTVAILEASHV